MKLSNVNISIALLISRASLGKQLTICSSDRIIGQQQMKDKYFFQPKKLFIPYQLLMLESIQNSNVSHPKASKAPCPMPHLSFFFSYWRRNKGRRKKVPGSICRLPRKEESSRFHLIFFFFSWRFHPSVRIVIWRGKQFTIEIFMPLWRISKAFCRLCEYSFEINLNVKLKNG